MKTKPPLSRTPRPRAAGKPKADPRQAHLPHVPGSAEADSEAAAPPKQTLKIPEVLAELENAAKPLNVRVTYEAIGGELGAGGLCKVKGLWRVIIDKRTTPSERVSVLAPALARFDFASLPLSPQVRELLSRVAPAPIVVPADPTAEETGERAPADAVAEETADATPEAAESSAAAPVGNSSAHQDSPAGAAAGAP